MEDDFNDLDGIRVIHRFMEVGALGLDLTLASVERFEISVLELEEGLRLWSPCLSGIKPSLRNAFPYFSLKYPAEKSWKCLHSSYHGHLDEMFKKYFPVVEDHFWFGEGLIPGKRNESYSRFDSPLADPDKRRKIFSISVALFLAGDRARRPLTPYEWLAPAEHPGFTKLENDKLERIRYLSAKFEQGGGLRAKLIEESRPIFERERKQWDALYSRMQGGFFRRPPDEDVKP